MRTDDVRIARGVNLSTATTAVLTYDYRQGTATYEADDQIAVEVSNDAGTNWTTLTTYSGAVTPGSATFTLEDFETLTANYLVRFRVSGYTGTGGGSAYETFYVDNVQVAYASGYTTSSVTFTQTPAMAQDFTLSAGNATVRGLRAAQQQRAVAHGERDGHAQERRHNHRQRRDGGREPGE